MVGANNGKIRSVIKENAISLSIGFAVLAWILDSFLDSLIFNESTILRQIIAPTIDEILIRSLFGSIIILFGIYVQLSMIRLKKAEDAMKEAVTKAEDEENKTKEIIEAIGVGIILQDTDYKIVYQNQIQNERYGNCVGEYCYKVYEGRDSICEDCPVEVSFKDGKIHKTERKVPTDKGISYIELTGSPLRDSTGKIIGGVKVVRDITRRRRAEEALRESEEKYHALFEAAPIGIGIADLEGKVLDCNANMLKMTGFALEELKSTDVSATYVDPDERKSLLKTLQETGRVRDWEGRLKRKDGTVYYASLNADLLELKGHKVLLTTARDISERKQAEKEKDRFLKAFASSTDGITIADEKDRFIYVNEAYATIFGYSQEELIGKTWRKITPPEMIAPTEKGLSTTMYNRNVGVFCGEVPGLRMDGRTIPTEVRGKGIWDENGKYQGHICIVNDITERKRMEESLKLFSEAVEAAQNGVQIADLGGHILYSNKAVEEIYGFSPAEYKGKHVDEMNADPEFASSVILPSLRDTGRWVGELVVKHKDGHAFPVWLTTSMIRNISGEPIAFVGIISDITERKQMEGELRKAHDDLELRIRERTAELVKTNETLQAEIIERKRIENALRESEEKYRTLIDNIQDGVFIIQDDIIQFANEAFARVGGHTVEEVIGKDFRELVAPEDLEMVAGRYRQRQMGKDVPGEYEFHIMHRDGRTRILVNMNVGLITYRGMVASMGTVKDITEKRRLESQLLRAQRMESIGTLASGIAHDINNVLTPIMLSHELLREKVTDKESLQLLNTIKRSTHRGANLMKQVLSLAKGIEGERNPLQVTRIISEIRQIAIETFPRNIEIRTDTPKDLWTISADATQLHQVLMNLSVNARDAMPNGGTLSISAENLFIDESYARMNTDAKVGSYIVITVSDTGTGIPPGVIDRIFEPFFTTKEHGKGTGLGLSTSLGIVKSHGGFINVYSEIGKGTVFKVYLPAITTPETLKAQVYQYEVPSGHGESILVVDDEDQIREITRKTLETHGYRVLTAIDGKGAIALYSQHREKIKAVLMDMMMPVMDGKAGIRELRKINPEVKVIALSGLTDKEKPEKDDAHVQAFLMKPYTAERLLNTLHDILSTK